MTSPDKAELVFLPLGGCNEIGMNLNAYGYGPPEHRKWILVDVGVTFGDHRTPGIDLICPDPEFFREFADDIEAIFLTHAHEDHIGAVGLLWPYFRAPLYATPFTAELVRQKLAERGLDTEAEVRELQLGGEAQAGAFKVRYVTLTHSIPEPNALSIETPLGRIFHTGDWKIDPDPLVGKDFDHEGVTALGDAGVLAMVCDSTNVFEEGEAGSELSVRESLTEVIGKQTGRVAVTTFASNVARLSSVIHAANLHGRSVCLVGRSMHRITAAAQSVGMLKGARFVDEEEAGFLPPENILYLCTGSQGEPRAALSRIARGEHPNVSLDEGDTVIFSSRVIPGNERVIFDMQNDLANRGVHLITDRMAHIHVSGHPCRDELRRMYQMVRPKIAVPVHGERRHIVEHADFARTLQVPRAVTPRNGDLLRLAPGDPEVLDEVPVGRLLLDGDRLLPEGASGVMERIRLSQYGLLSISVALDGDGELVDGPLTTSRGLSERDGRLADESLDEFEEAIEDAVTGMKRADALEDDRVERLIVRVARKVSERVFGKRPIIDVTVLRTE
jgi:ribonuclease J